MASVLTLTLVMREQVPVNCRRIWQNFSPAGVTSPFVARAIPSGEDGRGQSVNLAVRTLPLLISIVVSIVAPHPIHPFSFLFPSAERRQVQVVVGAD
jgi:hypothetical protein